MTSNVNGGHQSEIDNTFAQLKSYNASMSAMATNKDVVGVSKVAISASESVVVKSKSSVKDNSGGDKANETSSGGGGGAAGLLKRSFKNKAPKLHKFKFSTKTSSKVEKKLEEVVVQTRVYIYALFC